jgi:S-(hydroxymethyl)glutathione dehydrogenase/alcohol dehydrogenase
MVRGAVMHNFMEPLKVESLKLKPLREGEIVVKMVASGVCHSDLSVVQAKLPVPPPVVLGHEGAGIVEEVGKGVTDLKPGDHVVLAWVANCGKCHYCANERTHLCEQAIQSAMMGQEAVFEMGGVDVSRMAGVGSFADHTIVRATSAIKVRDDVPLETACLVGCGVMTGVGAAINTAKVRPGQTVAVFGCGGVGLNVIQGAALSGAARIIAVDLAPSKLKLAQQFGATDVVNAKDNPDAPSAIKELTDGHGVDYAFEVVGTGALIQQAYLSLKRGGMMLSLEEKSLLGCLYGSANVRRDMPLLLDLYMQKRLKIDELVSKKIKLDDVNAAFEAMEKGEVARSVIVY